jgi:hypothetical protein
MFRRNKESVQVPSQCVFVCPGGVVDTRLVESQMVQARFQGATTTVRLRGAAESEGVQRSGGDSGNRARERGPEAMRAESKGLRRSTVMPRAGVAHEDSVDAHSVGLSAGVGVKTAGRVVRAGERGGEMKSVSKHAGSTAGHSGAKRRQAGGGRKRQGARGQAAESPACAPCSSGAFRQRETGGPVRA